MIMISCVMMTASFIVSFIVLKSSRTWEKDC
jgi:hypothetical protein